VVSTTVTGKPAFPRLVAEKSHEPFPPALTTTAPAPRARNQDAARFASSASVGRMPV
jgi:hypothetical protein